MGFLIVFAGAGLGGACRHGVNLLALRALGPNGVPAGTVAINVLGSFLMGAIIEWFALRGAVSPHGARLFLTTGMLGGFTTFSAFSLEAILLWQRGEVGLCALYVLGSVALSLAGLLLGLSLVRLAA